MSIKNVLDGIIEDEYNRVLWFGWQKDEQLARREEL